MENAPAVATLQGEQRLLVARLATRFGIDQEALWKTLKATVFKLPNGKEATNAQVAAVMVVADQHKLNPFTREIFAFEKDGAIIPVVSVDGWIRIINEQPAYDGVEFEYGPPAEGDKHKGAPQWIEAIIYRKDRSKPTRGREFMAECYRGTGPWGSHPSRMLRHKALIQCARMAFGFAGIYDEDEAERILEGERIVPIKPGGKLAAINADIEGQISDSTTEPEKTSEAAPGPETAAPAVEQTAPAPAAPPPAKPKLTQDEAFAALQARAADRAKPKPAVAAPTLAELLTMVGQALNDDAVDVALSLGDKAQLGPPEFAALRDACRLRKIELET